MHIRKYGILLRSIIPDELEQVRQWRNMPHIRSQMQFQEYITPEMHLNWWNALDPQQDLYWMVEVAGEAKGVANIKAMDFEVKRGEAGIFIADENTETSGPLATLLLMDFAREVAGLRTLRAKMRTDNPSILAYNKNLGYVPISEPKAPAPFSYFEVDLADWHQQWKSKKDALNRRFGAPQIDFTEKEKAIWKHHIASCNEFIIS